MLKLYFTPSTCALASHIALEHAGAAHHRRRTAELPEVKKALAAEAR